MNINFNNYLVLSKTAKLIQTLELFLIVVLAFAPAIFSSVFIILTGYESQQIPNNNAAALTWGSKIISDLAVIAVLLYVLFRQGRNLSHLGFNPVKKDIIISLGLAIVAYLSFICCWYLFASGYYLNTGYVLGENAPKNIGFLKSGITAWSLTAMLVNPFYEEIIVRAYVMSEVKYLTNSKFLAIIISVLIQTSYHLYQGLASAWALAPMFLIYSLYYAKSRRIFPIILAHMYFDLMALWGYSG